MEDVLKIASYIYQRYMQEYGRKIDEMKLHKLLYLVQREAIIETGEPLFDEQFEAWRYGPVMYRVHTHYQTDDLNEQLPVDKVDKYRTIFDKVFSTYAGKSSWSLSTLSHGEYSWRKARQGYSPDDPCKVKMRIDDIRVDAERIKQRRSMRKLLGIEKA